MAGRWESLRPMPTARFECSAASLGRRLYVAGGASAAGEPLTAVERYDPATDRWERLPNLAQARFGAAMAAARGRMYVLGGSAHRGTVLNSVERFDLDGTAWISIAAMPLPRHRCGAVAVAGRLYVLGGSSAIGAELPLSADCMVLQHEVWEEEEDRALPPPLLARARCAAVLVPS